MRPFIPLAGMTMGVVLAATLAPRSPGASASGAIVAVTETFDSTSLADLPHTGARWSSGTLSSGYGGGSGRLGDLVVPSGQTVVLSTDSEDFSGITAPEVFDPTGVIDGQVTAAGGVFDFASVTIEAGGVLRFEGSEPARLFARGDMTIAGTLDVSGGDAPDHESTDVLGGPGGLGGPAGADGGAGAEQPDGTAFLGVVGGAHANPGAIVDGTNGGGIPIPSSLNPTGEAGGGIGGLHHPFDLPDDPLDILVVEWDIVLICQTKMIGSIGGGGGYAFDGDGGVTGILPGAGLFPTPPPPGVGGSALFLNDVIRRLSPERGFLRGGSGGAGGGAHIAGSSTNGTVFVDCLTAIVGSPAVINQYIPHSAAGGGGAGGAAQVVAGDLLTVLGVVDTSGGNGGANLVDLDRVMPGGGGAGGVALIQARKLALAPLPGRIDVSGGDGGTGTGLSLGGTGSPGLVRVETIHPSPDLDAIDDAIAPSPADLAAEWGGIPADIASVAPWSRQTKGPGALSGAQSCWRSVAGTPSHLEFVPDSLTGPGWDMTVIVAGVGPVSWRDTNPILPSTLEELFGTDLFGAPIVVRFQGARSAGPITNPCDVELYGAGTDIVPGSLTPWVKHPAELNALIVDPTKKPDLFRFQVLFDSSKALASTILAVEDLTVLADPQ